MYENQAPDDLLCVINSFGAESMVAIPGSHYHRDNEFWTAGRYLEFKATRLCPGGSREVQESAGGVPSLVLSSVGIKPLNITLNLVRKDLHGYKGNTV